MKHAILIMAHKNVKHLCRLIKYFEQNCDVFLHVDQKQSISQDDLHLYFPILKTLNRSFD